MPKTLSEVRSCGSRLMIPRHVTPFTTSFASRFKIIRQETRLRCRSEKVSAAAKTACASVPSFPEFDRLPPTVPSVGAGELCRVSKESRSLTRAVGEPDINQPPDLICTAGTKSPRPKSEPLAAQRLGAQVPGEVQLRDTKEVLWHILSVDQHGGAVTVADDSPFRPRIQALIWSTDTIFISGFPSRTRSAGLQKAAPQS